MSIFRFPEKIPTFFYLIFFLSLLGVLSAVTPLISNQDIDFIISIKDETNWSFSRIIDLHFLIYKTFYSIIGSLISDQYQILRLINFLYLLLIVFITYKIIKLKFYDLHYLMPLTAVLLSGTILISITTSGNSKNVLHAINYLNKRYYGGGRGIRTPERDCSL